MFVAFTLKKGLFSKHLFSTNGNYVLKTFVTSVREKRWVQKIYQPHKIDKFSQNVLIRHLWASTFPLRLFFVIFPVQILSFGEKLLLGIEYLFNKTDPKHFLKVNLLKRLWESGFITSPTDNSNNGSSWRYRSLPQKPADVKMVDGVLWWWVWISGEEWWWGSTCGGRYPLKDDPCTAGERAAAKTKPAVERKG